MVLHSDESFIEELKIWQQRAGGRPFTIAYEVIDCERGPHEMVDTFSRKREKMIRVVDVTATQVNPDGEKIVRFVPVVPTCSQVLTHFDGYNESALFAARVKVEQELCDIRIFERLRPPLDMIENTNSTETETRLLHHPLGLSRKIAVPRGENYIEWRIGSVTEKIADEVFVQAYVAICNALTCLPSTDT
jgi:hypothetical protein